MYKIYRYVNMDEKYLCAGAAKGISNTLVLCGTYIYILTDKSPLDAIEVNKISGALDKPN